MRVLLTGASGFLGSHLLRWLLECGHEVGALLRPTSDQTRIADCAGRYQLIVASLDCLVDSEAAIRDFAPEALVHLAWEGVGNAARNDRRQLTNIEQTRALVDLAIDAGARHVLATGSQAEYGPCREPIDERQATQPTTLYGVAKLAAQHVMRQLCAAHGARYAWLRVFSTYGPQDGPNWMIPQLIDKLLRREHVALTAGEQRWDYLYANDAAEAAVAVLESDAAEGVFNLGSGQPTTIRAIACLARDLIEPGVPLGFGEIPYRPDQVMRLEARIDRLVQATGWRPKVTLEAGLRRTIAWHRQQHAANGFARAA